MTQSSGVQTGSGRVYEFIADPCRAVWTLALPVMMGMAVQTLYGIADMIFVGRLGGEAIAAVTFTMPLSFFVIGIIFGLGTGATAAIARYLGSGNKAAAGNAAEHALLLGLGSGAILAAGCLILEYWLFALLGVPAPILPLAASYFRIIAAGFIITTLNVTLRSIMTGEGDTRTPVLYQGAGTLLNLALDPLFIFALHGGVAGAAWATVVSQLLVLGAFLVHFFARQATYVDLELRHFSYSRNIIVRILKVGIPASASMVVMSVGGMLFNRIIVTFGSGGVAAYGVGGRLDSIYFMPTFALASSMTTLAGMFYGAARLDLVRHVLRYTIVRGQVLALGLGAAFYLFAPQIFRIFTPDPEIVRIAISYIRFEVFAFPFVTAGIISGRTFQGLGSGLPGLVLTSLRVVIIAVPLAYLLSTVAGLGLQGVWLAMPVSGCVSSVVGLWWLLVRLRRLEGEAPSGGLVHRYGSP